MQNLENRIGIVKVYEMLWDILSLYEETECFNKLPKGVMNIDIWDYMTERFKEVRKAVATLYLGKENIRNRLMIIVDETESFVRLYEVPGISTRWRQINPKIMYFSCAFDVKENDKKIYTEMRRGLSYAKLDCYPDEEFCKERKEYFEKIDKSNRENNFKWSENKIFEMELLNTLTLVFENDFKSEL